MRHVTFPARAQCRLMARIAALILVVSQGTMALAEDLRFDNGDEAIVDGRRYSDVTTGVDALVTVVATNGTQSGGSTSPGANTGSSGDLGFALLDPVPNTNPAVLFRIAFVQADTMTPTTLQSVEFRVAGLGQPVPVETFRETLTTPALASFTLDTPTSWVIGGSGGFLMSGCTFWVVGDDPPDFLALSYENVSEILIEYSAPGSADSLVPSRGMSFDGDRELPINSPVISSSCPSLIPVPTLGPFGVVVLSVLLLAGGLYVLSLRRRFDAQR